MTQEDFAQICLEYVQAEKMKFDAEALAELARETYQGALQRLSAAIIANPDFVQEAQ